MSKCECGKVLTEEEIEFNEKVAKQLKEKPLNMCASCWSDYCHHAETGQ